MIVKKWVKNVAPVIPAINSPFQNGNSTNATIKKVIVAGTTIEITIFLLRIISSNFLLLQKKLIPYIINQHAQKKLVQLVNILMLFEKFLTHSLIKTNINTTPYANATYDNVDSLLYFFNPSGCLTIDIYIIIIL
jgi:hypothetical protein